MTMTAVLLTIFIAVVSPLLADELKAWSCWLPLKLLRMAVAMLPEKYRDRYNEEWQGVIEEIPGQLLRLGYSIGLLRAAIGIRNAAPPCALRDGTTFALLLKRMIDLTFAGTSILFLSPQIIMIAIAIKLDSPGPVFYGSERIGKNGLVFRCFKFRTMASNADERSREMFRIPHDPRITRLGHFLRKYSLDELPQFLNVLRGEMSLVGPRPPLVSEVKEYKQMLLLDVKPGITGLWQVNRHQKPSMTNYVSMNVNYIKNWSIWLDIKIILRTIWIGLTGF
jgi:lipopolysaccharide/colanic/teichoic acid biosynthesis glycosyltransferase